MLGIQPGALYWTACVLTAVGWVVHTGLDAKMTFGAAPVFWTFQEYWIHRALMHGPTGDVQKSHRGHHKHPTDSRRLFIPVVLTLVCGSINAALWVVLCGARTAASMHMGYTLSYLAFETAHCCAHGFVRKRFVSREVVRHHMLHHAVASREVNFGFTTPAWDFVFATNFGGTPLLSLRRLPFPLVAFA